MYHTLSPLSTPSALLSALLAGTAEGRTFAVAAGAAALALAHSLEERKK